jgi:Zn-dependent M16 (insulinase) family peptidase
MNLLLDTLLQFHALHYHPSAARFVTYGSFPVERILPALHDLALSKFDRRSPPKLLLEPRRRCGRREL